MQKSPVRLRYTPQQFVQIIQYIGLPCINILPAPYFNTPVVNLIINLLLLLDKFKMIDNSEDFAINCDYLISLSRIQFFFSSAGNEMAR
jgi:hypothetical protein